MITTVLGILICFTLPMLIFTCVLVCLLWPKQQSSKSNADVESHAVRTTTEQTNLLRIANIVNKLIGLTNIEQTLSTLHNDKKGLFKVSSVANTLIRFGHIQDIAGLESLTSHLTGVVIVLNPAVHNDKCKQKKQNKALTLCE